MKAMTANEALAKMRQAADLIVELKQANLIIGADLDWEKNAVTFQLNPRSDDGRKAWRTLAKTTGKLATRNLYRAEGRESYFHKLRDDSVELLRITDKKATA